MVRVKNNTPFVQGMKVASRQPPALEATWIVKGTFTLVPGEPLVPLVDMEARQLSAEEYDPADEERTGACTRPGDFADYKLYAEVLAAGKCHVPGGVATDVCPVEVHVGDWSKRLAVFGPRFWKKGLIGSSIPDAMPFTSMDLGYRNAYGGNGFAANPVGKGHEDLELPNIERPDALIVRSGDKPQPAGFGAINPSWPSRVKKRGKKYGAAWRKERLPFFAEDFDWSYFQEAPEDQWLPDYLRGDESLRFVNMHPEVAHFEATLPGTRVRVFVRDDEERFREVAMQLDTLYADLEAGELTLTWRGLDPVRTEDLTDVRFAIIAAEQLTEPARPVAAYEEQMRELVADPIGYEAATAEILAQAEADLQETLTADDGDAPQLGAIGQALGARGLSGEHAAALESKVSGLIESLSASAEAGGVDLKQRLAESLAGGPPGTGASMQQLRETLDNLKRSTAAAGVELPGIEQIEALVQNGPMSIVHPELRTDGAGAGEEIEAGPGADLQGRMFTGLDLSGRDLSGANFRYADLSGANLEGANLEGANLTEAILSDARLAAANLAGATLERTVLDGCQGQAAVLRGVRVFQVVVDGADFTGADFSEADIQLSIVTKCKLDGARFDGIKTHQLSLDESSLTKASFVGAECKMSEFAGSTMGEADFSGAELERCSFAKSDLTDASFAGASGVGSYFAGATLTRTDFQRARLPETMFPKAQIDGADFSHANLPGSRFDQAAIAATRFQGAGLMDADFSKAVIRTADFAGANLYQGKFLKSVLEDCGFDGANMKRVLREDA